MITIAGSINLDLVARVDHLPAPGETVSGVGYAEAPGGKGANQALAARRAGHEVRMAGCTGDDANADAALSLLDGASVDLSAVRRLAEEPTGVALILVDAETGENQIAVVPGANARVLEATDDLILSAGNALLLQMEIPDTAVARALEAARAAGAVSYLNIAPFRPAAAELARHADVVIANETEFAALTGEIGLADDSIDAQMARLAAELKAAIVLTLGADGAFAATADGMARAASPAIEPVDTVGAGDTFCGYLAAARAEGKDWPEALDLACRAGALACLTEGAQPSIPDRARVDAFKA
ncbi:MAG: ribokinase [Roseitalea sp.]|jgi:ribokinase|nr:ribokinase [Roseitalea sp.]MBO6952553.1 ribokinase [Rhizobiaceae bacterium]MBO6592961.1 ribokinase [Roseitalea sp.]MBO6600297.1 ribokinase [Roseitalea sp.]MBO6613689.1 ribokinase [Roseitalea sp.]